MRNSIIFVVTIVLILLAFYLWRYDFKTRKVLPYNHTYKFLDRTMSYSVLGEGKELILLHGAFTNYPWNGFEKELAKKYKVYLPALPGFGPSDSIEERLHNTDLFSDALCVFVKEKNLEQAPIIALSLGTIVSVKAAAKGCLKGELILVGMPGKISEKTAFLVQKLPLPLKRFLARSLLVQRFIILPALRENVGKTRDGSDYAFLKLLRYTSSRSLADVDYKKEVEIDLPKAFKKVNNKTHFIYGEKDKLRYTSAFLTKQYITIAEAGHNPFADNPGEMLVVLERILK